MHTSRIAQAWFAENEIEVLPWPSRSPDCNPIENIWGYIVKKIYKYDFRPNNREELIAAIQQEWATLTPQYTQTLAQSMNRRLASVIQQNGAPTKY